MFWCGICYSTDVVQKHIRTVREFFIRHQRHLTSWSLLLGFVVDMVTLRRIDLISNQLILEGYILMIGVGIALINVYQVSVRPPRWLERFYVYLPVIVQFAFGNIFSGFMVLYSRSTSLVASWPFLLLLLGLLIGNEMFQPYYLRFRFQSALFFFTVLSFFIVYIPLITGTLGPWTFLFSTALAILFFIGYLRLLSFKTPVLIAENKKNIFSIIGGIAVIVSIFYFTNLIPPIPLSLEDGGAYHRVEHTADGYILTEEAGGTPHFLARFFVDPTLHITSDESVYIYSSVFAPTKLKTTIVHEWEWFDETKDRWVSLTGIPFPISGGRDEGYRGYTFKNFVPEGHWRVNVKTENGQVIGRIKFNIIYVDTPPPLTTELR